MLSNGTGKDPFSSANLRIKSQRRSLTGNLGESLVSLIKEFKSRHKQKIKDTVCTQIETSGQFLTVSRGKYQARQAVT